jgi:hypothetical protein
MMVSVVGGVFFAENRLRIRNHQLRIRSGFRGKTSGQILRRAGREVGPTSRPNRRVLHFRPVVKNSPSDFERLSGTTGKAKRVVFAWQRLPLTLVPKGLAQTLPSANNGAEGAENAAALPPARTARFPTPLLGTTPAVYNARRPYRAQALPGEVTAWQRPR